jgi:hypothetical protein
MDAGEGRLMRRAPLGIGVPALAISIGGTSTGEYSLEETYDHGEDGFLAVQWVALAAVTCVGSMRD